MSFSTKVTENENKVFTLSSNFENNTLNFVPDIIQPL
jgi:hypothetical protein